MMPIRFISTAGYRSATALAGAGGLWCVDPIDGTSNFVNGLPYFAVSVALLQGGRPVLGVVYNPVAEEVFWAERGGGAFLNGEKLPIKSRANNARVRETCCLLEIPRAAFLAIYNGDSGATVSLHHAIHRSLKPAPVERKGKILPVPCISNFSKRLLKKNGRS